MRSTSRDPGTFEEFVAATAPRMQRAAYLLCGDHHLAEDLTQATYAKVFAHWRTVSRADNPVAYTRTVLTRTFLSQRRRRSSGETPVEQLGDSRSSMPSPDSDTRLDLLAALAELSPADRTVVVLRYWEDLSVAETARLLDLTESACRARSKRALDRLRRHFPDLSDKD